MTGDEHTHASHAHHRDWDDTATWSKEILQEPALVPATEALLDAVELRPGQRLLDLACGLGHTTAAATARGVDALGIDLSAKRIAAAQTRFPHAKFAVADASNPPAGPWDAIVCRFGAHHLAPTWAHAAHATLAPGGRLAIAEWPPRDEREHANGMRRARQWENVLTEAGFQQVRVETVGMRFAELSNPDAALETREEHDRWFADRDVHIISGRKGGR